MTPTGTYFVKWLIPVIVLSAHSVFLLLNLVTTISDPIKGHVLLSCDSKMHKKSFVLRYLFTYM